MRACEAESRINALQVTEITVTNFPDSGTVMNAVYALVEYDHKLTRVVGTHGKCTANPKNWSEDTLQLMKELIASMEEDLIPRHFATQLNPNTEKNDNDKRTEARGLEEADQV
jgi:hypothetical protein